MVQPVKNLPSIYEDSGLIPGLPQLSQGSSIAMSCGVDGRHGLTTALLWLWCRLAAVTLIQPLARNFQKYAAGAALKRERKKKKKAGSLRTLCRLQGIWGGKEWQPQKHCFFPASGWPRALTMHLLAFLDPSVSKLNVT